MVKTHIYMDVNIPQKSPCTCFFYLLWLDVGADLWKGASLWVRQLERICTKFPQDKTQWWEFKKETNVEEHIGFSRQ